MTADSLNLTVLNSKLPNLPAATQFSKSVDFRDKFLKLIQALLAQKVLRTPNKSTSAKIAQIGMARRFFKFGRVSQLQASWGTLKGTSMVPKHYMECESLLGMLYALAEDVSTLARLGVLGNPSFWEDAERLAWLMLSICSFLLNGTQVYENWETNWKPKFRRAVWKVLKPMADLFDILIAMGYQLGGSHSAHLQIWMRGFSALMSIASFVEAEH